METGIDSFISHVKKWKFWGEKDYQWALHAYQLFQFYKENPILDGAEKTRIPPVIHFLWIGDKPVPSSFE